MKKFILVLITLLLALSVFGDEKVAKNKWKYVMTKDGVAVYKKHSKTSRMDEFMGIMVMDSPLEVISMVFMDINNHKDWVGDCVDSKLVKDLSGNLKTIFNERNKKEKSTVSVIQYYLINAPWPVSDRDVIVKANIIINWKKNTIFVYSHALPKYIYPNKKGVVRMAEMKITWKLYRVSDKKTKVIYIVKSNPGGKIPTGIANWSSSQLPYKTLKAFNKVAKKDKYIKLAEKKIGKSFK